MRLQSVSATKHAPKRHVKSSGPSVRSRHRTPAAATCLASSAAKTVLVPVANGGEEIEAVTLIDVLRRAGADVTVASVEESLQVEMSRQVLVTADKLITDCAATVFDAIALPVGLLVCAGCSLHPVLEDFCAICC